MREANHRIADAHRLCRGPPISDLDPRGKVELTSIFKMDIESDFARYSSMPCAFSASATSASNCFRRNCAMPAGLIEDENGVGARGHLGGDLVEIATWRYALTTRPATAAPARQGAPGRRPPPPAPWAAKAKAGIGNVQDGNCGLLGFLRSRSPRIAVP